MEFRNSRKKEKEEKKNSHSNKANTEHQGPAQGLVLLMLLGASLKKNVNTKPHVNTKPQEGQKKIPILHCTLVLVGKGTLLELARVSMLPCCAHAEKRPEVYIFDVKMA